MIAYNHQPMECLKFKRIFLTCMIWARNGHQPYDDLDMKILWLRRNDKTSSYTPTTYHVKF